MVNIRSNSGSAHCFSRAIASVLAVILMLSLVFAPAVKASAEGTGSSAELKMSVEGLDISLKAFADVESPVFALLGTIGADGETMADAAVYVTAQSLILESVSFLGQAYGVDLTKYAENLPASVFAPNSGSQLALDEETYAMLTGGIQMNVESTLSNINLEALETLGTALAAPISAIGTTLMDSAEINMAPKTLKLATGDVAVTRMTLTFGPEALGNAAVQFLGDIQKDESIQPAIAEVYDLLLASGNMTVPDELAGMTGAEIMAQVWQILPQLSQEIPGVLSDSGVSISVSASTDKATEQLVAVGLALTVEDETMTVDVTFAENNYGVQAFIPGEDSVAAWVVIPQNDDDGFAIVLSASEGEYDIAALSFAWDKNSGEYVLNVDDSAVNGTIQTGEDAIVITVDTIDGESYGDISLTLRGTDTLGVPSFTEVLTMSEDEIMQVVQTVAEVAESLSGVVDSF